MSLSRLNRFRKKIGVRLSFWYAILFTLSALILFGLAYLLVSKSIKQRDHDEIRLTLQTLAKEYHSGEVESLEEGAGLEEAARQMGPLFIRIAGPDRKTLFLNHPREWARFDLSSLETGSAAPQGEWILLREKDDHHRLEIASVQLPDGVVLQVGKNTKEREELLERFRRIFLAVAFPIVALGAVGGSLFALRALRPIRDIIATVQSIEEGRMEGRVPVTSTGDELDELGRLFNQMLGKIEALINGMKGSLDNVAHDLRTPMTRLRAVAEMALRNDLDREAYREALIACLEESEQILMMLNTLMDISEAETGTMPLQRAPVNLASLMEDAVDLYRPVAEEKGIVIEMKSPSTLISIVDPTRMRQVLANLIDNAVKYTARGGRVDLEATQEGEEIVIQVKDTGIGIPPEEIDRIWDRLYRGDRSRSERGLGLGLSLVKAIVTAHEGKITASSGPGAGSRFTLSLPAAPRSAALFPPSSIT
ncbi:MAG: HAMP domain-containing protein [Nitrospirae bacterium]|nr:HAMP domain-containing protein [Candidatus Manganitrophaceae bacterium]